MQTATRPRGKKTGAVVGVSTSDPKLHVVGSAAKPAEALVLQKRIWDILSHAQLPVEIVNWRCGDHGSDEETVIKLEYMNNGIDGSNISRAMPVAV